MAAYKRQCVPSHDRPEQVTGKEQGEDGEKTDTQAALNLDGGGERERQGGAEGVNLLVGSLRKNSSSSDTSGSWEAVVLSYQRVHKLQ